MCAYDKLPKTLEALIEDASIQGCSNPSNPCTQSIYTMAQSTDIGTALRPKYIRHGYMDPYKQGCMLYINININININIYIYIYTCTLYIR